MHFLEGRVLEDVVEERRREAERSGKGKIEAENVDWWEEEVERKWKRNWSRRFLKFVKDNELREGGELEKEKWESWGEEDTRFQQRKKTLIMDIALDIFVHMLLLLYSTLLYNKNKLFYFFPF